MTGLSVILWQGRRLCVAALLLALFPSEAVAQANAFSASLLQRGFERVALRDGFEVFENRQSEINHFAIVGNLSAPPERVRDLLIDFPRQVGKVGRLSEAKVISKSDSSLLVYHRIKLPVINDRDYVLSVSWGQKGSEYWIRQQAVKNRGPAPQKNVVRVIRHEGRWRLHPTRNGSATLVSLETSIDLTGSIPSWMTQGGTARELPDMLKQIDALLRDTR